jgi:hypothetical protein
VRARTMFSMGTAAALAMQTTQPAMPLRKSTFYISHPAAQHQNRKRASFSSHLQYSGIASSFRVQNEKGENGAGIFAAATPSISVELSRQDELDDEDSAVESTRTSPTQTADHHAVADSELSTDLKKSADVSQNSVNAIRVASSAHAVAPVSSAVAHVVLPFSTTSASATAAATHDAPKRVRALRAVVTAATIINFLRSVVKSHPSSSELRGIPDSFATSSATNSADDSRTSRPASPANTHATDGTEPPNPSFLAEPNVVLSLPGYAKQRTPSRQERTMSRHSTSVVAVLPAADVLADADYEYSGDAKGKGLVLCCTGLRTWLGSHLNDPLFIIPRQVRSAYCRSVFYAIALCGRALSIERTILFPFRRFSHVG